MLNENDGLKEEPDSSDWSDRVPGPAGDSANQPVQPNEKTSIQRILEEDHSFLKTLDGIPDVPAFKKKRKRKVLPLRTFLIYSGLITIAILALIQLNPDFKDWIIAQNKQTISGQEGQVTEVILDDGTLVKLNTDSHIQLAESFGQLNTRKVFVDGEVYLSISKHIEKPFVIETDHATIKTLGATLNLRVSDQGETALIVMKGDVVFEHIDQLPSVDLHSNQGAIFSSSKRTIITKGGNLENYLSWWTDNLQYENTPLWIITRQLHNLYGVEFELDSEDLKQQRFSGQLDNTSLEIILDKLSEELNFYYQFEEETNKYTLEAL